MKKLAIVLIAAAAFTPHLAEAGAYSLARGAFAGLADWKDTLSGQHATGQAVTHGRSVWIGTSKSGGFVKLNPQPEPPAPRSAPF